MNPLIVVATFLASGVEWVEALTIVLAVGLFKGWRNALTGTVAAGVGLVGIVVVFGFAVSTYAAVLPVVRTVVGFFLLVFGLRWIAKAILRGAGLKAVRDEAKEFEKAKAYLEGHTERTFWNLDRAGVATSFSGVFLEGLEVVFIVIALGGLNNGLAAVTGALIGLVAVIGIGVVARRPLTAVPENAMKFVVGVMLTGFGTFFAGEGVGVNWWRDDVALLPLLGIYLVVALGLTFYLSRPVAGERTPTAVERVAREVWGELWGLLVGDSAIATVALAVLFGIGFLLARVSGAGNVAEVLLVLGVLATVLVGVFEGGVKRKVKAPTPAIQPASGELAPAGATGQGDDGHRPPARTGGTKQPVR